MAGRPAAGAAVGVGVEIRVLGPLEVLVADRRVDLGGLRQQIVLACLALEANRVVPVSRLTVAIYGDDLPSTSRAQTQICISSLRRLFASHGRREAIVTRSGGYLLQAEPGEIDLHRYEELLLLARESRHARRLPEAVQHYRAALALWRGAALEGIDSRLVRAAANRLDDRRITANEDCIELELSLGQPADLAGELTGLIAGYPLRERLRGQLMLALYGAGRQAEALAVYRAARRAMIEELGIEPTEWLQRLERAILTSDPSLNARPAPAPVAVEPAGGPDRDLPTSPVPNLLPTDIADFTGRGAQIDAIKGQLALGREDAGQLAVPVVVVIGKPGVGKTTLAVHVAHQQAGDYPDGQLFADLHGRAARRVGPMQVLERFLRTLGVAGSAMPDGLEERAEMFRDLLSVRRMLVVLDNAGDERQVLPLLPGNPRSAVLITSSGRLAGLPGAFHVEVDVLEPPQSVELLSRSVGAGRVQAEASTAAELAELCSHLPLALRIAGARLAARPHWSLAQLVARLDNEARRLDELRHAGMGIRASLSLACEAIGEDSLRLFRRLAVLDFPAFSGWMSAALLDMPIPEAQDLLDDLADAQLVETTSAGYGLHNQYRFHDLIRVFARERLVAEESAADRKAALERVLGGLVFLSLEASRRARGGDYLGVRSGATEWPLPDRMAGDLVTPPLPWFERERATIVAAIAQAAQSGLVDLCWDLTVTAVTLFETRVYLNDWRDTHQLALRAVRQAGDLRGEGAIRLSTGSLYIVESRFDDARRELERAVGLFRLVDDAPGEALAGRHLALVDRINGDLPSASGRYEQALAVFRRDGHLVEAAFVLYGLAQVVLESGQDAEARRLLTEALELGHRTGNRRVQAQVLRRLGELHLQADEPELAAGVFGQALSAAQDAGDDPVGEAYAWHGLGLSHLQTGELDQAGAALRDALELASSAGAHLAEIRASLGLGELELARTHPEQAVAHLRQALDLLRGVSAPVLERRVRAMLADAEAAADSPGEQTAPAQRSAATAPEAGRRA